MYTLDLLPPSNSGKWRIIGIPYKKKLWTKSKPGDSANVTFLGWWKRDPWGDKKVTLNHLEGFNMYTLLGVFKGLKFRKGFKTKGFNMLHPWKFWHETGMMVKPETLRMHFARHHHDFPELNLQCCHCWKGEHSNMKPKHPQ